MDPINSEYRFSRAYPFKGRGLYQLKRRVGGIETEIAAQLQWKTPLRVLEIGCGYGTALLEIGQLYRSSIELYGINLRASDGDQATVQMNAQRLGIDANTAASINIEYCDASYGLPFRDESFDIVFSQLTWLYICDKLNALREVRRVLQIGGIAKIEVLFWPEQNDPEHKELLILNTDKNILKSVEFLASLSGVYLQKTQQRAAATIVGQSPWPQAWHLVDAINLKDFGEHNIGTKSVYDIEPAFGNSQ